MEKGHWKLQPLYRPNQPPGKTRADRYIQVANRTLACERAWSKLASWTLHSVIAKKMVYHILQDCSIWQQQRHQLWKQDESTTNKLWETCAAPSNSWQHVNWGSKHGWLTEEEEVLVGVLKFRAAVCGIFWSLPSGDFSMHSDFLPSFIGWWFQPMK